MTLEAAELGAPDTDENVDLEIHACLDPNQPKSFFLYAGAGSGKTRSLKNALDEFRDRYGADFRRSGRRIAVITYTNAAADEIASRVGHDSLFPISTIHSFCWYVIERHSSDIQAWLLENLPKDLAELREKQSKGRAGSKAAQDRERAISSTTKRLEWLSIPRRFTYNPNGDNFGSDSLSHAEVLKITASLIITKPSMQAVLVNKFPFLLIDESQDTNRLLMDSLFALAAANKGKFALGLFGDTMQRIYADGKPDLGLDIPEGWATPSKRMNHRCPKRVVQLGNSLRAAVDGKRQLAREDSAVGIVRLFIVRANAIDKPKVEESVCVRMAEICSDPEWLNQAMIKTLTLEHHMAASRCGFLPMFEALDQDSRLSTGARKGDLSGLRFFTEKVAPLLGAASDGNKFGVMAQLRKHSPLLRKEALTNADPLRAAREAVDALVALDVDNQSTTFLDVLKCVAAHGLFEVPSGLRAFVADGSGAEPQRPSSEPQDVDFSDVPEEEAETSPSSLQAWRAFLETPYKQTKPFVEYIGEMGPYGTHQGVKGLEFDRVLIVL
ncbi:MAG: UvrD-helicase domain-containing protein, partial [Cyanobacteria bacterium SZAS TMP-1]|nr:UvrD-helicase domain-containing protein [Cyanobacteria bacterium SZAS TMP-1]